MRIENNSKRTIRQISLITGQTFDITREFFESLFTIILLDYLEEKPTNIPFFGKVKIEYKGDKMKKGGKQAVVEFDFKPSNYLLRNIGQIEDKTSCDIEKLFKKKIRFNLEKLIKE